MGLGAAVSPGGLWRADFHSGSTADICSSTVFAVQVRGRKLVVQCNWRIAIVPFLMHSNPPIPKKIRDHLVKCKITNQCKTETRLNAD